MTHVDQYTHIAQDVVIDPNRIRKGIVQLLVHLIELVRSSRSRRTASKIAPLSGGFAVVRRTNPMRADRFNKLYP